MFVTCKVRGDIPALSLPARQGEHDLDWEASLRPFHGGDMLVRPLRFGDLKLVSIRLGDVRCDEGDASRCSYVRLMTRQRLSATASHIGETRQPSPSEPENVQASST
jgi:hypothetical protein